MHNENTNYTPCIECDLEFLTKLNVMLASDPDYRKNINSALKIIGNHTHPDRIHILEIHPNMSISILHEWCNQSISPMKDAVQEHRFVFDKELEKQLETQNYITIDETDEFSSNEIRDLLKEHSGKNIILFPLYEAGHQFAFIAFTQCRNKHPWSDCEIQLMITLASIIAANLNKNLIVSKLIHELSVKKKQIERSNELTDQMMLFNAQIGTAWQQLKKELAPTISPNMESLEYNIRTFDKLCRELSGR